MKINGATIAHGDINTLLTLIQRSMDGAKVKMNQAAHEGFAKLVA